MVNLVIFLYQLFRFIKNMSTNNLYPRYFILVIFCFCWTSVTWSQEVYLNEPIGPFILTAPPVIPAAPEKIFDFYMPQESAHRDLAIYVKCNQKPITVIGIFLNNVLVTNLELSNLQGFDGWAVLPSNFVKAGFNTLGFALVRGMENPVASVEFMSHKAIHQSLTGLPTLTTTYLLEPRINTIYDWTNNQVNVWCVLGGANMQLVNNASGTLQVGGRSYPFQYVNNSPVVDNPAKLINKGLLGWYLATIPMSELSAGNNPARIYFTAPEAEPMQRWVSLYRVHDSWREGSISINSASLPDKSGRIQTIRMAFPFRETMLDSSVVPYTFDVVLPTGNNLNAAFLNTLIPSTGDGNYEFNHLVEWIDNVHGLGGAVYLAPQTGKNLAASYDGYLYHFAVDGYSVYEDGVWDPVVIPGGAWDQWLNIGNMMGLYSSAAYGKVRLSGSEKQDLVDDVRYRTQFMAKGEQWGLTMKIGNREIGETAGLKVGEQQQIQIHIQAVSAIQEVRLISNEKGKVGEVVQSWTPAKASVSLSYPMTANLNSYYRLYARDKAGNELYGLPIFVAVRPSEKSEVIARIGEPAFPSTLPNTFPNEIVTSFTTNQSTLKVPVLFGAGKTQRVQLDFTPQTTGNYIVEVGVDPLADVDSLTALFSTGKFLVFKLNGVKMGTHRSYVSINDANNELTPMLVPVRISLGQLMAGSLYQLEISSDAGGDGIVATYFYLYKSGFKTESLVDTHCHGRNEKKLSRTLGFNYINTGEKGYTSNFIGNRSTLAELSDEMMLLEYAGEANNAFGTCHISMVFINPTASNIGWYNRKRDEDTQAVALAMDGLGILNHPDADRLYGWYLNEYQWGTSELQFHGFGGWDMIGGHFGWSEQQWKTITLAEQLNGYGSYGRFNGSAETESTPELRWNEQLDLFVSHNRRAPIFGVAATDVNTDPKGAHNKTHSVGTYLLAPDHTMESYESALKMGNSIMSGNLYSRMIVTVEDANGNFYCPGNEITGPAPYTVHIEAWSPKPYTKIRILDGNGVVQETTVNARYIKQTYILDHLPPIYWFRILLRGDDPRTSALTNPFFRAQY